MNSKKKALKPEEKMKRAAAIQLFTALFSMSGGMFVLLRFGAELFACSFAVWPKALAGNPLDFCMTVGQSTFNTMMWIIRYQPEALITVSGTIHVTITSIRLGLGKLRRGATVTITKPVL